MKIIVISPSRTSETETKTVTELFEHGLETFHLRKPSMSTREMRQYIESIPGHFHERIIIHSHHALAGKFPLKGIHLTRLHEKRKIRTWLRLRLLRLRKSKLVVTTSFHKLASLYTNKKQYDYVLLGTIFDAVSEKINVGYSEHSLHAGLEKSLVPVMARGGTSIENIETCERLGFAGMVFYGSVWKKEKPVEEFCRIKEHFRAMNIKVE